VATLPTGGLRIEISLDRPREDALAGLLADVAEIDRGTLRRVTHAWLGAPDAERPHRVPGGVARTVKWCAYFTPTGTATTAKL
jgi:hypothetical protein